MSRRYLTADDVRRMGGPEIVVDNSTVVTPQAQEVAVSMGVTIKTAQGTWSEPEPDRGPDAERAARSLPNMPEPSDEHMGTGVIVTCVGRNRPGVLGELTQVVGEVGANINDVSQKMVGDYFHLVLVVEMPSPQHFADLKARLDALSGQGGYVVRVMHERVFRFMHRI